MIHQPPSKNNPGGGVIVYNYEDFTGLLLGYASANYPKLGKGSSWQKSINSFRDLGILEPGFIPVNIGTTTSNISAQLNGAVVDRTGAQPNVWMIEKGTKIHQIPGSGGAIGAVIRVTAPFDPNGYVIPAEGTHASSNHTAPVGEDIIIYNISGTDYVFYSYNDSSDGDIGRVGLVPTATTDFDDDWFSTQISSEVLSKVPHQMIIGDDRYLYIADGQELQYIAPDGTCSKKTTIVPNNFTIKSMTKTGTHLVLFCDRLSGSTDNFAKGEIVALFWNYSSTRADYVFQIEDNEVSCGFIHEGVVGCFTSGKPSEFGNIGYRNKMQLFNGKGFTKMFGFPDSAPRYNAWDIHNGLFVWYSQGDIYAYGTILPNTEKGFNHIGLTAGAGTAGICKSINGTDIWISSGTGASAGGLEGYGNTSNTYDSNAQWKGQLAEPLFPMGYKGQIEMVEVGFYGSFTGGLKLDLSLDTDYGTSTTIIDDLTVVVSGKQIVYKKLTSAGVSLPSFNVVKPYFQWSAGVSATASPKVSYLKIYYSLIPIVI